MEPSVEPVSARTRWRFTFVLSIKVHTKILVIFIAIITDTLSSWSKYFSICGRFFNATPFLFDLFLSQSKSEFVVLIRLAIYYLSGRNIAMAILLYSSNSLQPSLNTFLVLGFFGMGSWKMTTDKEFQSSSSSCSCLFFSLAQKRIIEEKM